MEIFKAIIDLVDKIVWPGTILIIFISLRSCLVNFINSILVVLKERGGEIKTAWGEIKLESSIEKKIEEEKDVL